MRAHVMTHLPLRRMILVSQKFLGLALTLQHAPHPHKPRRPHCPTPNAPACIKDNIIAACLYILLQALSSFMQVGLSVLTLGGKHCAMLHCRC